MNTDLIRHLEQYLAHSKCYTHICFKTCIFIDIPATRKIFLANLFVT